MSRLEAECVNVSCGGEKKRRQGGERFLQIVRLADRAAVTHNCHLSDDGDDHPSRLGRGVFCVVDCVCSTGLEFMEKTQNKNKKPLLARVCTDRSQ